MTATKRILILLAVLALAPACALDEAQEGSMGDVDMADHAGPVARATLGGGCFWCIEAVYARVDGVLTAVSGYSGGTADTADYRTVCSGLTDHAEVVQVTYDPSVIGYREILAIFFQSHDPTTKDRQGGDAGRQYRSVIFCHDDEQRALAEAAVRELDEAMVFPAPIVTEIATFEAFYPAEVGHQDYYALNPNQGYCRMVIAPKVAKIEKVLEEMGRRKK